MEKWQKFYEQAKSGKIDLREYLTRSEGPQLFVDVINDILIQAGTPELPNSWDQIYASIPLNSQRTIRFPSIRGVNPDMVPELSEFKMLDPTFTSILVETFKFGQRLGISSEMLADNEIGLIGWRSQELARAMRQLKRQEAFKCLSFFSTGPAVSTGAIGNENHGPFYAQGGFTNFFSATAMSWEERIDGALNRLKVQTITVGPANRTISFPVVGDTIVANPTHERNIRKVLNAGITVVSVGIGVTGQGTNVAGTNVFNNLVPNQVYDPTIPTGQCFIMQAKRGLVMVEREPLQVDEFQNFAFDATELRVKERYAPAVIEERFICDIQIS